MNVRKNKFLLTTAVFLAGVSLGARRERIDEEDNRGQGGPSNFAQPETGARDGPF